MSSPGSSLARLSSGRAHLESALVSSIYVLFIYVFQVIFLPRGGLGLSRDVPQVIKIRLLAVSCATCVSVGVVMYTVFSLSSGETSAPLEVTLELLGLSSVNSTSRVKPHLITPLLFLGPLYVHLLSGTLPLMSAWSFQKDFLGVIFSWNGLRNYIIAPITEEITYRACICSILHLAGFGKGFMIFVAPLWFGLAHVHHAYENYVRPGRTQVALRRAIFASAFQFAYTTLFGWYSSYLFLRTGSIAVPIASHIFCNFMGVPQIQWELRSFPAHRTPIMATYLAGIVLFVLTLAPWTTTEGSVYW
ncbi:Abi-domain-containing protein [Rickenella mellea]|uniref:intramembrane prenyl-peptidase Rce1 n=1 Tax=Rickenella mellea TaxID=50990 RepID=A0A4Y7PHZ4_9AGAM|nr:Abi-domain-containing protein [Rickenella mellea]